MLAESSLAWTRLAIFRTNEDSQAQEVNAGQHRLNFYEHPISDKDPRPHEDMYVDIRIEKSFVADTAAAPEETKRLTEKPALKEPAPIAEEVVDLSVIPELPEGAFYENHIQWNSTTSTRANLTIDSTTFPSR